MRSKRGNVHREPALSDGDSASEGERAGCGTNFLAPSSDGPSEEFLDDVD